MNPDDAIDAARRAAAERRDTYAADAALAGDLDAAIGPEGVTPELLREWAMIEVEPSAIYSTRRLGAPVTLLKRVLMRLLRQYTAQLEARQTRFNVALLGRLEELEGRIEALERRPPS
jgi:hypothetical protein